VPALLGHFHNRLMTERIALNAIRYARSDSFALDPWSDRRGATGDDWKAVEGPEFLESLEQTILKGKARSLRGPFHVEAHLPTVLRMLEYF